MIDRERVEQMLKVNGISPAAPDEELRALLLSARFNKEDVETALMVLRQDIKTKGKRVDGLHKVFRTDNALNSHEISTLLGVDISLFESILQTDAKKKHVMKLNPYLIWSLSFLLACGGMTMYMYAYRIVLFSPVARYILSL